MKPRFFSLMIILFLFEQSSAQNGWYWQYPKPQGNTLRDIFIFGQSAAISVGDLGTVIKTTNGGTSWDVQHHAGGTPYDLCGIHFIDPRTGWAVGGTRIFAPNKNVLLKTLDGGKIWAEKKTGVDSLNFNAVYFVNSDTGFVIGEDGVILRTTDGGNSWVRRTMDDYIGSWLDIFDLNAITFTDERTGWIVGAGYYGNQIYKTTDCGITWRWDEWIIRPKIFTGLLDICFLDQNRGFIIGDHGAFLETTNGGTTWQYQNLSEKYQKEEYQYFSSVCFTDSITGWIVGLGFRGFILETTDGGENWTEKMRTTESLLKVSFDGNSSGQIGWIIGSDGILLRTIDAGENWISQREDTFQFSSIFFVNETTGWAVGSRGVILHTTDGGTNWYKQNQNDSLSLSSIYAMDAQNALAVGAVIKGLSIYDRNGIIFKTTNGGQTWTRQTFDTLYGFSSIVFVNDSTGWISGTRTLLKTNDKGISWVKVALDADVPKGKIQFINENIGWIGGILKTIDGGKNWNPQMIPITSLNSFYFGNAETGWAVGDYDGRNNIFKTKDGGENWAPCGSPPIAHYYSVHFVNERTGWAVGEYYLNQKSSSIIKTTDGGKTWIDQNGPLKTGLTNIFFLNESTGWVVGDGIIKTTSGGGVVSVDDQEEPENNPPKQMILFQNYPNPFNPVTQIRYGLSVTSQVSLKIYDMLGREVAVLINNETKGAGWHMAEWDSRDKGRNLVASGTYICRLVVGEQVQTLKITLMK